MIGKVLVPTADATPSVGAWRAAMNDIERSGGEQEIKKNPAAIYKLLRRLTWSLPLRSDLGHLTQHKQTAGAALLPLAHTPGRRQGRGGWHLYNPLHKESADGSGWIHPPRTGCVIHKELRSQDLLQNDSSLQQCH